MLREAVRCLAIDHPDNEKFGFIKWFIDFDGSHVIVGPDWSDPGPSEGQVNELADAGCVMQLEQRAFQPTAMGRRVAAELERREASTPSAESPDLSWGSMQATMRIVYEAWKAAGAPYIGVPTESIDGLPSNVGPVLTQLQGHGWLDLSEGLGTSLPARLTPTTEGIAAMERWPTSPEAAQEQLQAAISAAIQSAPEEDRGRLRQIGENVAELSAGTAWALLMAQFGIGG